ncbi:MAG TPA: PIG-L family deacetylase [Terriglobales bacterium]|nr:PIG-L family deacetylase [Terriglobales bacterium]
MAGILCVTAHPDDEAGAFGGSLRLYHDRGVQTAVVCLTPGQAATNRGGFSCDEELSAVRRREFEASCALLKVTHGEVLNYPDAKLYRQNLYDVVCELVLRIRKFQPDVLITFGPEGGVTGHNDHSMASIFATMAFHWAGRSNRYPDQLNNGLQPHVTKKLYYATADSPLADRPPITLPPSTTIIEIGDYLQTKISAFKAHTTQSPLWPRVEDLLRRRGKQENFHLVASVIPGAIQPETDLFAGINAV